MPGRSIVRALLIVVASITAAGLPGCVIGGVQQSLDQTNAALALIQEDLAALRTSTERMSEMDEEVVRIREELSALRATTARIAQLDSGIEAGVQQLDSVGSSLTELEGQVDSVAGSLRDLDVHLASLRRTLQKVNKIVPFVDVADDAPIKEPGKK